MKHEKFDYEKVRIVEQQFENELEKVFLNFRARLKHLDITTRERIVKDKEMEVLRRLFNKYV